MKKKLIIAAVVIVLLAGLTALVFLLPDSGNDTEVSASPDVSLEPVTTKYLINEKFSDLSDIRVYDAEGTLISRIFPSGDNDFDVEPKRKGWKYDEDAIRASAINVSTLSSLSTVAENPDDLAQYGLDAPAWRIEARFGEDRAYTLEVGSPTALNNSYYCSVGDGNVYAVGAYSVSQLTRREMDYRTYEFFPDYYDEEQLTYETNGEITYVRAVDPATDYEMLVRAATEEERGELSSGFFMEKPFEGLCNDDAVEQSLINVAVAIKINGIFIDDPTDAQLSEYGFDEPREVWLKNSGGDEVHYYIGQTVGTNAYVMVEGLDTILTAENVSDALFSVDYVDLLFKLFVTENVRDVEKVEFFTPEGEHILELSYEEPTEENKTGTVSGSVDGEPISSQNASRLFAHVIAVQVYEAYDPDEVTPASTPAYRFVVTRKDGKTVMLELHELNSRRYAAFLDGEETGFAVHRDVLTKISDAFDILREGGDLPRPN